MGIWAPWGPLPPSWLPLRPTLCGLPVLEGGPRGPHTPKRPAQGSAQGRDPAVPARPSGIFHPHETCLPRPAGDQHLGGRFRDLVMARVLCLRDTPRPVHTAARQGLSLCAGLAWGVCRPGGALGGRSFVSRRAGGR